MCDRQGEFQVVTGSEGVVRRALRRDVWMQDNRASARSRPSSTLARWSCVTGCWEAARRRGTSTPTTLCTHNPAKTIKTTAASMRTRVRRGPSSVRVVRGGTTVLRWLSSRLVFRPTQAVSTLVRLIEDHSSFSYGCVWCPCVRTALALARGWASCRYTAFCGWRLSIPSESAHFSLSVTSAVHELCWDEEQHA